MLHPAQSADEARSETVTAWDELRLQEWADPHDLNADMVVVAARNSAINALCFGA